jgi:hypothetical protein
LHHARMALRHILGQGWAGERSHDPSH